MPVASATDGGHRDCPVLASVAQWPEIQPLVSRVKSFPLTSHNGRTGGRTDGWTDDYNLNTGIIMMISGFYDICRCY